jgi:hypothetical protein
MSLNIVINYLEEYPLFSSKFLEYKDWKKIVILILESKYYTEQDIYKAEFIKNNMNRQRTDFSWQHLEYLSFKEKKLL